MALVLETSEFSGGYVLGFRVEKLEEVYTEVCNLFKTYSQSPVFGVECVFEEVEQNIEAVTIPRAEDNLEIIETGYDHMAAVQSSHAYKQDQNKVEKEGSKKDVVFSPEIGLAIEKLPPGTSLE